MGNFLLGSLAYLGLARAYALEAMMARPSGQSAQIITPPRAEPLQHAREAYEKFFQLWEDADPDVPALRDAHAEYNKLMRQAAVVGHR